MKITPAAAPTAVSQATSNQTDSRSKAIAAFMGSQSSTGQQTGQQPEQKVVQSQNNVQAEEMAAIKAPTTRQEDVIEEQQATEEVTTEAQTEKPKEDPALSRQFAQLARQEKALRAKAQQQEQAWKQKEADLAAREAKLNGTPQFDPKQYYTKDQVKQNALEVLAEAGVSYEELTQQIISQQPVDPRLQNTITQLKQQIQELKQANDDSKKSYAEQQTAQYDAAVKQIREDVNKLVFTDPNFETIKATKAAKDVVELITKTYEKDGVLLTVEEAAQQVEDYLVEEGTKIAQISKIRKKLAEAAQPKSASKPAQTQAETTKQPQPMKTLTNATGNSRQLSARERAMLAFKGQLKS